jgi:uncharacterized membrane protein
VRSAPNWPLLGLALAGSALAAYLSWIDWAGASAKGCAVGSGCEVVLGSRWATLLGLPTAYWGLVAYLTLAATAFIRRVDWHWRTAWSVALGGVLYSAYLTTISLTVLQAACPYCLTSLALMSAIFVLVTVQRPASIEGFSWRGWLSRTVPVAAAVIVALHLHYTGILGQPPEAEDPTARALAVHLTSVGAKMYGAYWCPHCIEQKEIFGGAARRLPYIECATGPQGSPQAEPCRAASIRLYPTWIIGGVRFEEVLSQARLAEITGFQPPAPGAPH